MAVRPFRASDRAQALALVREPAAIDSPGQHTHVIEEEGSIVAVSIGITPDGEEAMLGTILLKDRSRMDLLHELLMAKVEHAIELGYEYGSTRIRRRDLVERSERVYGLTAEPVGRDPRSGRTVEWRFRVHLPTFLEQLRKLTP